MFYNIRPVGNAVSSLVQEYNPELFAPFRFECFQSGTAALAAACLAAKQKNSSIVSPNIILPAYACPDLVSAVTYAGVEPRLVDLMPERPWLDLVDLKNSIDQNTIAVIAVNFLGIPERIKEIRSITSKYDALIIEDSAQGIPNTNTSGYWQGDLVVLSFGRGKPLSLLGGGAVLSRDESLLKLLPKPEIMPTSLLATTRYLIKLRLYNFLIRPFPYFALQKLPGINLGQTKFKLLESISNCPDYITQRLASNHQIYQQRTTHNERIHQILSEVNIDSLIDLPKACNVPHHSPLLRYPFLIFDPTIRSKILTSLESNRLGFSQMYKTVLPDISGVPKKIFPDSSKYPNAVRFSEALMTLPTHEGINNKTCDRYIRFFAIVKTELKA